MARIPAKGIYSNAQVIIAKDGTLQAVTAGQRTPSQIDSVVTERVGATLGTAYQNIGSATVLVSGWVTTSPGGSTGALVVRIGATNPPGTKIWGNEVTATVNGADSGFQFFVPPDGWYEITATGAITGIGGLFEMKLSLA